MRKIIQTLIIALVLLAGCGVVVTVDDRALINTPIPTTTLTPTNTLTPTATSMPTTMTNLELTVTSMPIPTLSPTQTNAPTPSPEPTATSTPTPTATPSPKPTATSTPKPTATPSPIPTNTPIPKLEYTIMPDIVGMRWEDAKEKLIAAGLQPTKIIMFESSDTIPGFHVTFQSIEPGMRLEVGTCVDFKLSLLGLVQEPSPTPTVIPQPTATPTVIPRPTATPIPTPMAEIVKEEPFENIFMKTTYADGTIITQYSEDEGGVLDRFIYYPDGTVIEEHKDGSYTIEINDMLIEDYQASWGEVEYYEYNSEGKVIRKREIQDADSKETIYLYMYDENGECIGRGRLIKKENWYERYGINIYLLSIVDYQDDTEYFRIVNSDGSYNQWSDVKYYSGLVAGLSSENLRLYTLEDKEAVNIPIVDLINSGYGANDK